MSRRKGRTLATDKTQRDELGVDQRALSRRAWADVAKRKERAGIGTTTRALLNLLQKQAQNALCLSGSC
jgi:hypothetical protein